MVDYQGNANKDKEPKKVPEKKVERVVVNEVLVQKKGVGKKLKETFIAADLKSVTGYLVTDVLVPAAKNMIVDTVIEGIKRTVWGESAMRRMGVNRGSYTSYQSPVSRGYGGSPLRSSPPVAIGPTRQGVRHPREEFILTTKEEAEMVVQEMTNIIEQYDVASVGDLNTLVGYPSSPTDQKWGWTALGNVQISQVREGFLIELPPLEAI